MAAVLVLLATAALLVWGGRLGWFAVPTPVSYERGWVPRWGEPRPTLSPAGAAGDPRASDRCEPGSPSSRGTSSARREPRSSSGPGAVIALSRRLDALRADAPREAAAVEAAARRLARTLAATEFRDLETSPCGRLRATWPSWTGGSARRETGARRPPSSGRPIPRRWLTCRSVPCARTLRPPTPRWRRSCASWGAACRRRPRPPPPATTTAGSELRREVRYAVTGAPGVRLLRVELRAFRGAAPSGAPREPRLRGGRRGRAPGSARHLARSRAGSARRRDRPSVGRAGGSAAGPRDLPPARVRAARGRSPRPRPTTS